MVGRFGYAVAAPATATEDETDDKYPFALLREPDDAARAEPAEPAEAASLRSSVRGGRPASAEPPGVMASRAGVDAPSSSPVPADPSRRTGTHPRPGRRLPLHPCRADDERPDHRRRVALHPADHITTYSWQRQLPDGANSYDQPWTMPPQPAGPVVVQLTVRLADGRSNYRQRGVTVVGA